MPLDSINEDAAWGVGSLPPHGSLMWRAISARPCDEVDSVLVDEGRSPLIISGPGDEPEGHQQRYTVASEVASHLREGPDYTVDRKQKTAEMTERGRGAIENKHYPIDQR